MSTQTLLPPALNYSIESVSKSVSALQNFYSYGTPNNSYPSETPRIHRQDEFYEFAEISSTITYYVRTACIIYIYPCGTRVMKHGLCFIPWKNNYSSILRRCNRRIWSRWRTRRGKSIGPGFVIVHVVQQLQSVHDFCLLISVQKTNDHYKKRDEY